MQNIRTVVQLNKEEYFHGKYTKCLETPFRSVLPLRWTSMVHLYPSSFSASLKRAHLFGFFSGVTNGVIYFILLTLFLVGAHLVNKNAVTLEAIFQ